MESRFRIRTREGQLLEPRTMEIFAELVRSGVVRPEDEIFDALTGVWMRAELHPMVELFKDPLVAHPDAEGLSRRFAEQVAEPDPPVTQGPAPTEAAPTTDAHVEAAPPSVPRAEEPAPDVDIETIPLELAPPVEESPEEAQRAFIEKMEEERRREEEVAEDHAMDLPLVTVDSDIVEPASEAESHLRDSIGARPTPPQRRVRAARPNVLGIAAFVSVLLLLAVVSVRVARAAFGFGEEEEAETAVAEPERPPRAVPRTEEQIRQDAYRGFLGRVEALGTELAPGEVPSAWLEGFYLADPDAYPEVRAYWQHYLSFADAAQAREVSLYRQAYLTSATEAGVSGPVRSLRMASALEDFVASRRERAEHYEHIRELAAAAIGLHDLAVDLRGRISYEPIRGERVSADPVIEAVGTDPEAQALLDAALDRVLVALRGRDGTSARDRARIPGWLLDGLKRLESP